MHLQEFLQLRYFVILGGEAEAELIKIEDVSKSTEEDWACASFVISFFSHKNIEENVQCWWRAAKRGDELQRRAFCIELSNYCSQFAEMVNVEMGKFCSCYRRVHGEGRCRHAPNLQ